METYQGTNGKWRARAASEDFFSLDDSGFCVACGAEAYGVEPDARRYECEACGEKRVYGLQEALLMGLVDVE